MSDNTSDAIKALKQQVQTALLDLDTKSNNTINKHESSVKKYNNDTDDGNSFSIGKFPSTFTKKIDTNKIRSLIDQDGNIKNRGELVDVIADALDSLDQEKQNAYDVVNEVTSRMPLLDSFTLMSLSKFFEVVGGSSKEETRLLKILSDLLLQWEILDSNSNQDDGYYSSGNNEDKPDGLFS